MPMFQNAKHKRGGLVKFGSNSEKSIKKKERKKKFAM